MNTKEIESKLKTVCEHCKHMWIEYREFPVECNDEDCSIFISKGEKK